MFAFSFCNSDLLNATGTADTGARGRPSTENLKTFGQMLASALP